MVLLSKPEDAADSAFQESAIRAREGDNSAFASLVELHERRVYNLILGIVRTPEDAEDVAQEVWLKVAKAFPQLRDPQRFLPWLFRIARNTALDHVQARKTRTF